MRTRLASPYPVRSALRFDRALIDLPAWAEWTDLAAAGQELPIEFAFRRGETLGEILHGFGLTPGDAHTVVSEMSKHVDVRRLKPTDRYAALVDAEDRFQGFQLTLSGKGRVIVRRDGESWESSWKPFVEETEIRVVKGTLDGYLDACIQRAGGEMDLAYVMAEVLQWDLDFNRDLRLGDTFEILYEKVYLDGEFYRVGGILALIYDNDGRRLEAYKFGYDQGHYDADGRPLRKLFLRSPLRYSRITSGFSGRRFHPVLKRYRPHHGVDYGAPSGTPVRVTAAGVVQFVGWEGGGGKTVKVGHPNGYLTAYLHLSRFAGGMRPGRRVEQGDVVGYVGSTGLATASHLDYRMQRDGRWINPQSLKNEPAEPIPEDQLPEFFAQRDQLRQALVEGGSLEDGRGGERAWSTKQAGAAAERGDRVGR